MLQHLAGCLTFSSVYSNDLAGFFNQLLESCVITETRSASVQSHSASVSKGQMCEKKKNVSFTECVSKVAEARLSECVSKVAEAATICCVARVFKKKYSSYKSVIGLL